MGVALGILLKLLGFGKTLMGWLWDAFCGLCKFAVERPFQFLTIALALALLATGWYAYGTNQKLVATQKIVTEKVQFIQGQDKVMKQYVTALDTEKKNHVSDIKRSNEAVDSLKRAADRAAANAAEVGRQQAKKAQGYTDLANRQNANPSTGTPEQRIQREQETNDQFFKDWKGLPK